MAIDYYIGAVASQDIDIHKQLKWRQGKYRGRVSISGKVIIDGKEYYFEKEIPVSFTGTMLPHERRGLKTA